MNRLFAFAWLVAIATNGVQYYAQEAPYQAAVILAGAAYFVIVFRRELLRLVFYKDYLFVLSMFVFPFLLMLLSDRSFERGVYTSQIALSLVFVVASVLALQSDLDGPLRIAAFVIVAVGAAMNLYELLVANNVWSIAPGRSAGFYVNPNTSGEALLGYGLVFLTARAAKVRIVDLILTALVVVGEFATFSRAGIVASLVLITVAAVMRVQRKQMLRVVVGGVVMSVLAFAFASFVLTNVDLSKEAQLRIDSLLEAGGVGDYERDRGAAASDSLDIIGEYPVFGAGVNTSNEMREGPHNTFLAMMVDYGIGGLVLYLVVIIRLILSACRADRDLSAAVWLYVAWLVIFSFASHNMLGQPSTIPLMGFALARAFQIKFQRKARRLVSDFSPQFQRNLRQ
jgi:O-antigen ligase/polysaccharide polymerase Wzy-like membrane protein